MSSMVVMESWSFTEKILGRGMPLSAQALFEHKRSPLKLDDIATVGEAVQSFQGRTAVSRGSPNTSVQLAKFRLEVTSTEPRS